MAKPKHKAPEPVEVAETLVQGYKISHNEKPRFDLLPADAMLVLAKVATYGTFRYNERSWENGMPWGHLFRAMLTHAWKWWAGEEEDDSSGLPHLAHVAWNALALLAYVLREKGEDDRE